VRLTPAHLKTARALGGISMQCVEEGHRNGSMDDHSGMQGEVIPICNHEESDSVVEQGGEIHRENEPEEANAEG
jgi:hypothetical protein